MVGLGKKARSEDSEIEGHDLTREAIRTAISTGVRSLKDLGINEVLIGELINFSLFQSEVKKAGP